MKTIKVMMATMMLMIMIIITIVVVRTARTTIVINHDYRLLQLVINLGQPIKMLNQGLRFLYFVFHYTIVVYIIVAAAAIIIN